jgi:hypothetical protein
MAATVYKLTMGFGSAAVGSIPADGFTDVWYTVTSDPNVAVTRARGYMDRRVALCNSVVTGVRLRVSALPTNILAFQQRYRPGPGPFPTPDSPWNALWLTVATAAQGVRRQFLMRGMTDEFIVNGNWTPNGPQWATNFAEFTRYCKIDGQMSLQLVDNTKLLLTVTSVTTDGTVTLPTGHGIAKGNMVRFFRTSYDDKNLGNVKGNWLVTDTIGANQIVVNNWPPTGTVSKGKLRQIELVYPVVSDIQVAGIRKRSVGRPLELLSGRRRRKSA